MRHLQAQIREAYFNPILYFLPSFVFMVVNEFSNPAMAWKVSFPVAFGLMFYMFYVYKRMFLWHGLFATFYFVIGLTATILPGKSFLSPTVDKFLFVVFLLFVLIDKKFFQKMLKKTVPHRIPMTNNALALKKTAKTLLTILLGYLGFFFIFYSIYEGENFTPVLRKLQIVFAISILILTLLETFKVLMVRHKLVREDWLPIVDEKGVVTGSVQYQENASPGKRLMHPVVRFYFIENNRLLLQQRKPDDRSEAMLWDASVSRKVRLNHTVEESLQDKVTRLYSTRARSPMFLTNYIYEGKFCRNYIYLFVSCHTNSIDIQHDQLHVVKWWTISQIEQNLGSGIFSERFEKEFEILKRSGLLDGESFCDCDCVLKNTIKQVTSNGFKPLKV